MARTLTKLPRTQFSGLDFNNILEDVTQLVQDNPDFNENWNDFLSSNAGRMLVELFAYISDQLATRIDWVANENFIGTATQKKSVMRILKLIGYNFRLPTVSEVEVSASFDRPAGSFYLTPLYSAEQGTFDPFVLTARDKSGQVRSFELLNYDEENKRFEYKTGYEVNTGTISVPNLNHKLAFYEGRTIIDSFEIETDNNPIFTLTQNPVTENSIRVYRVDQSNGIITETELNEVNSFLDPEAQKETDDFGNKYEIPFIKNIEENNTVTIEFGPTSLLPEPTRRPRVGDVIRIFYRIGGGKDGNITKRSINTTKRLVANGENIKIDFVNYNAGIGGQEGESPEEAAVYAPLRVRTAGNTVTEDDYDITISSDNTVLKSKSYGNNNMPSNLYSLYGLYIRPLEIWNFILKNKPGWEEVPPSKYSQFKWIDLRLENRFNGKYAFRDGVFNERVSLTDDNFFSEEQINWDGNGEETFRNFVYISTNEEFSEAIFDEDGNPNSNFKAKIATQETENEYFDRLTINNVFSEKKSSNHGLIEGYTPTWSITERIDGYFISQENIFDGVDLTTDKYISLSFDNRTPIENIDLSSQASDNSSVQPTEIRDAINIAFRDDSNYNNGVSGTTKGYQEFGLSVDASSSISFNANRELHFRINSFEYFFLTPDEDGSLTFNELASEIEKAASFKVYGDLVNGQSQVTNVYTGLLIYEMKEGYRVEGDSIPADTYVGNIDVIEHTFTLVDSGGTEVDATANDTQQEIIVYPFAATIEGSSSSQDIRITNLRQNPVGPLWIENGTDSNSENNLLTNSAFSSAGFSSLEAVSPADGRSGYQELGINGVINATHGFQDFTNTSVSPNDTTYEFKLEVDGSSTNSGNDISITLTTSDDISNVASKIDTELGNLGISASSFVNSDGQVRIESDSIGSSSTISIGQPADGNSMIDLLGGTDDAVDGEDNGDSGLDTDTTYYFKINKKEFSITTGSSSPITFLDLESLISSAISSSSYSTSITGTEWNEDIRITHDSTGWINLDQADSSPDLFSELGSIVVLSGDTKNNVSWDGFEETIGGGDYSSVAFVVTETLENETRQFILLRSPGIGEFSSQTIFHYTSSNSALFKIFGVALSSGETSNNYGYRRATVITNEAMDRFGDIIYENGSVAFDVGFFDFYINHLSTDKKRLTIGRYFTDNFNSEEPAYREPATRIYNTYYDPNTFRIDPVKSDFYVRFTREETDSMSVFAIDNDWEVEEAAPAEIISVSDPQNNVDSSNYNIKLNIDGRGDVEFDITGDTGDSAGGSGYTIEELIDNINNSIRSDSNYDEGIYSRFSYATKSDDESKIVLSSPINNEDSSIEFKQPLSNDATNEVFGLDEANYPYLYEAQGDYYLEYDERTITGDFTSDSNWVTDISGSDMEKIEEGMRVLDVNPIGNETKVIEVDKDNNQIRLATSSGSDANDESFTVSNDIMNLLKLNTSTSTSKIPDLEFNFHFIFDKRYVEDAFDGAVIGDVQTPGFPEGTLDEDIYRSFLKNKKITGVENVFKETRFTTFDIKGTVFYDRVYSPADVEQRIKESLREEFRLENRDYGEQVAISEVMKAIQDNDGVDYVEIDYLGPDATDQETSVKNTISAKFDEIIVLSEDRFLAGTLIHGIMLNFKRSGA